MIKSGGGRASVGSSVHQCLRKPCVDAAMGGTRLCRSSLYFKVFLSLDEMWNNGAPYIWHHMTEGYFRCCLQLADLAVLHQRPDLLLLKESHFASLAAGDELPILDGAARSSALAVVDIVCDDEAAGAPEQAPLPAPALPDEVAWQQQESRHGVLAPRQAFSVHHMGLCVRFDGQSHSSGIQRGYIHCRNKALHGERCFKYRQITAFGDNHFECAAWLFAWEEAGQSDSIHDKQSHLSLEPAPQAVSMIRASLG